MPAIVEAYYCFKVLLPLWPVFMSYVLSFIYLGIYWSKLEYVNHPIWQATITEER